MSLPMTSPGYREVEFEFEGATARYLEGGAGFPLMLLHGVGPGTACQSNFRAILAPLVERYHVFAMDLIGFGRSGRKPKPPYFDFEFWFRQAQRLLERMPEGPVGIFGHSMSGALSLRLASGNPRIAAVLSTGAIGTRFALNAHLEKLWTFPETADELRETMKVLMFDDTSVTEDQLSDRLAVLHSGAYPSYFKAMFGGDKQSLINSSALDEQVLRDIRCPVWMVHGREDLPCPAEETTMRIVPHIPQADVTLLANCRHGPAAEHPAKVLAVANALFPQ